MSFKICHFCGKMRLTSRVSQWTTPTRHHSGWSRWISSKVEIISPLSTEPSVFYPSLSFWLTGRSSVRGIYSLSTKWNQPTGYDTGIKVYHPVVKDKVPLILGQEKLAQWYACGPTVYDSAHIGHASSYIRQDIIRRIMGSVFDIDTTLVLGITDVDDKIINRSIETGQDINQMSRFYEAEFFSDMANLNVSPPSVVTRVTDHIPVIIDFINGIQQRGLAYKAQDGSVYFDVKEYGRYGVFVSHPDKDKDESSHKRSSQDFALWKACKPGEPHWESPWGRGRPGWHIECSAMASGIFGCNFDLHSGGEDLIFPHHENELAQSCAFHGNQQWVNYWLHTGHLFVSGQNEKMSKSLKNVITLSELLEEYTPNQFRMLCLLSNYRKKIEFGEERMKKAMSTMNAFNSLIKRCDSYVKGQIDCGDIPEAELFEKLHTTRRAVEKAFADDFNTPQALANLMRLVKFMNQLLGEEADREKESSVRSNAPVAAVGVYVKRLLKQLGLDIGRRKAEEETETHLQFYKAVETVVNSRSNIRDFAKDKKFMIEKAEEAGIPGDKAKALMKTLYKPLWEASDKIRKDILSNANVQINDAVEGSTWSIVDSKRSSQKLKEQQEGQKITIRGSEDEDSDGGRNSPHSSAR
ncbi:probable cysteine--tRNA ligase, mitochondrial [Aplysia californica]|uniref:cysteine--tRNA ligase n=1 Tax=Aplysia californica TaxID=6500 RepID=A0ABM1VR10_APLCA|nr:probable cysteine--tRNA ligase, mitochondrial [Aplysia californica]XP_005095349.1 probable cysteine--tRNA ligase, mitochondrial [Aplysia californica]XP_012936254.1 probable cysteine--tRNA ligase, mitochondrial [Aplysia californica]XP_035824852.1 probable cysteine--tRNA ligase, mitochondrial [Aplysia californica]